MFGAVLKSYYAQKLRVDPNDLYVVSVIPCTAKKFECTRLEENTFNFRDVDVSLTTRELAKMIKGAGINFSDLCDERFDNPFEIASGAGAIFGATGGVMEAALRTAADVLEGDSNTKLEFKEVRGTAGLKEAKYKLGGKEIRIAVISGLANARVVLDDIKNGKRQYDFVEVMACQGGCINGGGQPVQGDSIRNYTDLKKLRAKALYDTDRKMTLRKSHESPVVKMLYDEYFDAPGKHRAHRLLHTSYVERQKF